MAIRILSLGMVSFLFCTRKFNKSDSRWVRSWGISLKYNFRFLVSKVYLPKIWVSMFWEDFLPVLFRMASILSISSSMLNGLVR